MTSTQAKSDAAELVDSYAGRHAVAQDRAAVAPGGAYIEPTKIDGGVLLTEHTIGDDKVLVVGQGGRVSSPELASLAAKYVSLTETEMLLQLNTPEARGDVRRLAASVLSQA